MRKKIFLAVSAAILAASMNIVSFAGQWKLDAVGYWWQNDDGSYPVSSWQWLDGNGDGVSECYYFDGNGYMLANTVTPDGYSVNGDGAWVVNGVVQTQTAAVQGNETQTAASYTDDYSGVYLVPYYTMDGTETLHAITITYDAASNSILYSDPVSGYTNTFTYYGPALNGWISFELVTPDEKEAIFFSAPGVMEANAWGGFRTVHRN